MSANDLTNGDAYSAANLESLVDPIRQLFDETAATRPPAVPTQQPQVEKSAAAKSTGKKSAMAKATGATAGGTTTKKKTNARTRSRQRAADNEIDALDDGIDSELSKAAAGGGILGKKC